MSKVQTFRRGDIVRVSKSYSEGFNGAGPIPSPYAGKRAEVIGGVFDADRNDYTLRFSDNTGGVSWFSGEFLTLEQDPDT